MRARASLSFALILGVAAVAGMAPASAGDPTAQSSAYKLIETFTFHPNSEVTARTQFQAAEDYAIVMSGTIESWDDGTNWRNQWDPWYLYGCTGECGEGVTTPSESHRPVAFDRRTGQYAALTNLGSGSNRPPFDAEHGYRLLLSDFGGVLKLRDRLGPFHDHHQGSFTFKIYEKTATPAVEFDFLQNNFRGATETTTRGRGTFRIKRRPDLRDGARTDEVSAVKSSLTGLVLKHRDEFAVRDDDVLRLDVEAASYQIKVTDKAVYEVVAFLARVDQSNDPDCAKGALLSIKVVEAKGAAGTGKVWVRAISGCEEHDHRAFTKRDKEDTVRVEVKGPKPLR